MHLPLLVILVSVTCILHPNLESMFKLAWNWYHYFGYLVTYPNYFVINLWSYQCIYSFKSAHMRIPNDEFSNSDALFHNRHMLNSNIVNKFILFCSILINLPTLVLLYPSHSLYIQLAGYLLLITPTFLGGKLIPAAGAWFGIFAFLQYLQRPSVMYTIILLSRI